MKKILISCCLLSLVIVLMVMNIDIDYNGNDYSKFYSRYRRFGREQVVTPRRNHSIINEDYVNKIDSSDLEYLHYISKNPKRTGNYYKYFYDINKYYE